MHIYTDSTVQSHAEGLVYTCPDSSVCGEVCTRTALGVMVTDDSNQAPFSRRHLILIWPVIHMFKAWLSKFVYTISEVWTLHVTVVITCMDLK